MSCFYLPKKLKQLPSCSKKAWKSFTSSLSPKLHNLRNHTLTKSATRLFDLHPNKRRRSIIPRPDSTRWATFNYYNNNNKPQHSNYQNLQPYTNSVPNSPATIYVDRLYGESFLSTSMLNNEASTSSGSTTRDGRSGRASGGGGGGDGGGGDGGAKKRKKVGKSKSWKEVVSSMPTVRGVDERADEFISKFRQEMQIQREQSIIEFQEMLARSA